MSKSYVLRALGILGLDEILNLSKVLSMKSAMKKAAGEDLIVWNDEPDKHEPPEPKKEAKVLSFPKSKSSFLDADSAPSKKDVGEDETPVSFLSTDVALMQREIAKGVGENIHKMEAHRGYQKSNEVYVVKSQTVEGKEKIRFASTDGVLVNKKQA